MLLNTFRRSWPLTILVAIILAAIIGGYFYFNAQLRTASVAAPVQTQLQQTEIGQTVTDLVKPSTQFSTMLTPSTEGWWKTVNGFVPDWQLAGKWSKLGIVKPKSLALVFYNGSYHNPQVVFGTPALFLQYSSQKAEKAAYATFTTGALAGVDYHIFQNGSTLVVFPSTAYSDKDFRNATQKLQVSSTTTPTKGYWSVNPGVLGQYLKSVQGSKNNAFYVKALQALGFDTTQQHVSWYASSTDGSNWQGQLTLDGDKNKGAWHQVAASTFFTLLTKSVQRVQYKVPNYKFDPKHPGKGTGGNFFIIKPNQSFLTNYFVISNNSSTDGQLVGFRTSKPTAVAPAKSGQVTYTLNPNAWFSGMMAPDQSAIFPLFSYNTATLTFNKKDPSLLNLRISE